MREWGSVGTGGAKSSKIFGYEQGMSIILDEIPEMETNFQAMMEIF
jgi:hypothetical protein